ncbi:MAG TPA: single-stranded-DNA-specific exonuclease RecJ [Thermoanaerobaculia bacterium]|nr:single-stranded-DNA-specific exonuclease RecJ [Thermoanaerobaculia bacterium]
MSARARAPRPVRRHLRPQHPDAAGRLTRELGLPAAAARVLSARGFEDVEAARRHLAPAAGTLHDPFAMAGLPAAVERLSATARRGGRVVVFGDYDCDGVGALAILTTALRKLGADARPFIPHRLNDGYGLRAPTLRRALEEHDPEGIVTVDCGITAVETVAEATDRGVYVVVTDHHLPPAELPEGAVLVDPKLPGCRYPFKDLCGAGLAWKLAEALFIHSGARVGVDAAARGRWLASFAKIAALSTVADMVPLTGENRVLVSWGLSGLADPRAPGLAALLRRAGVPKGRAPSTREVAFRIAPRLNAMGRLDHAARAFELLTTSDAARAEVLADEIEAANDERRAVQERVVETVLTRLTGRFDPVRDAIVVEAGEAADGWHRGVLGIAASRVAKELARPVLLLARDGDVLSGSGRTHGKTPLFARLAPVARRYTKEFGGHAAALGLTLPAASFEAFRDELRAAFAEARDEEEWAEELLVDTEVEAPEADESLARALEGLEPHGQENPKALLGFRGLEWDGRGRAVGERGLRVSFVANGRRLDAVGWSLQDIPPAARAGLVDVAANVAIDAYTGRASLTVVDVSPAAP